MAPGAPAGDTDGRASLVIVHGLPTARVVRRKDWGWELRNDFLVARSLKHAVQDGPYLGTVGSIDGSEGGLVGGIGPAPGHLWFEQWSD